MSKAVKTVCFCLVLALCVSAASYLVLRKPYGSSVNSDFYRSMPEDSVEVLFVGASGLGTCFNPAVIYDEYGITSFNLYSPAQMAFTQYYTLEAALKKQTPALVVLDASTLLRSSDVDDPFYEPYVREDIDAMPMSKLKLKAITDFARQSEDQGALSFLFPIIRYHDRWQSLTPTDVIGHKKGSISYGEENFGYRYSNAVLPVDPIIAIDSPQWESVSDEGGDAVDGAISDDAIDAGSQVYVERCLELLASKNIDTVFVKTPTVLWSMKQHDLINDFAESRGVEFIDMNTSEILDSLHLDSETDFYNSRHVNVFGGRKTSLYFGQQLRDKYAIPSLKGDKSAAAKCKRYDKYVPGYMSELELSTYYFVTLNGLDCGQLSAEYDSRYAQACASLEEAESLAASASEAGTDEGARETAAAAEKAAESARSDFEKLRQVYSRMLWNYENLYSRLNRNPEAAADDSADAEAEEPVAAAVTAADDADLEKLSGELAEFFGAIRKYQDISEKMPEYIESTDAAIKKAKKCLDSLQ